MAILPPYVRPEKPEKIDYKRLATEEAWEPPEMFKMYVDLLQNGALTDPGFVEGLIACSMRWTIGKPPKTPNSALRSRRTLDKILIYLCFRAQ